MAPMLTKSRCKRALPCCLRVCIGLIALSAGIASAAPTPYGLTFARSGSQWSEGGGYVEAAEITARDAPSEQQALLERVESRGGPYADDLAEPLGSLARHYRQQGDLEQAARLYRRALHVVRVNDGLYSERQVPLLRELISTYRSVGDMQTLDERYEYFFRLYGRGEPPFTELRLRAALEYLRWQREAIRRGLDAEMERRLLDLYHLNEKMLETVSLDATVDPALQSELAFSQLRNLYLIQHFVAPEKETVELPGNAAFVGGQWGEKEFGRRRLELIQRGAVSKGAELLQQLLVRSAEGTARQRARLQLELADWYQWNGRGSEADAHYAEVEKLLMQAGDESTLEQWLGQPRELPDNGVFWLPPVEAAAKTVEVTFDVSEQGRVENIRAGGGDDDSLSSRLRRKLSRTRFRPHYYRGKAQPVAGMYRRYLVVE